MSNFYEIKASGDPPGGWGVQAKRGQIKGLGGGVLRYAAQLIPQIDAEIVKKGHFLDGN